MAEPVSERSGTRMSARMAAFAVALLLTSLLFALPSIAQQDARAVRAAFVFNLTKYVVWPQSKRTLVIGFIGDSSSSSVMHQILEGKSTEGRTLQVLLNPSASELDSCDIVYVSSSEDAKLDNILPRLGKSPTLTVGEDSRFTRDGGMVGLIRSGDRIQIEINLEAAHAAGINMSSRLLLLATIVSTRSR